MKKPLLTLIRGPQDGVQTIGVLHGDDIKLFTLELPWRNNEFQKSCIKTGLYEVVPRWSQKYGDHFHITNVEDRDLILFHAANYVKQLLGCIGVGKKLLDINKDGRPDTTSSRDALDLLLKKYPNGFMLEIL